MRKNLNLLGNSIFLIMITLFKSVFDDEKYFLLKFGIKFFFNILLIFININLLINN